MGEPSTPDLEGLVEAELGLDAHTLERGGKPWLVHPGRDLFGLALSGGGIRSATFNLGLLQALHEVGLLRAFDYLSTVSGGGYIGSFWTAWRARSRGARADRIFPTADSDGGEAPEIRHLREFSNFLSPRLGILSYDTGRMVVAVVNAVVPSVLATLALVTLVLLGWLGLAWLLLHGIPGGAATAGDAARSTVTILAATALGLAVFEWTWRRRGEISTTPQYVLGALFAFIIVLAAWRALLALPYGAGSLYGATALVPLAAAPGAGRASEATPHPAWLWLFAPSIAWASAVIAVALWRWLTTRLSSGAAALDLAFDRIASRLAFGAAAWGVIALLWCAGAYLRPGAHGAELAASTSLLGALFALIQKFVARPAGLPLSPSLVARLEPRVPQIVAYVTIALLVIAIAISLIVAAEQRTLWMVAGAAGAITILMLCAFEPNHMGLHAFYRGRIARAFLGASNPEQGPRGTNTTEDRASDDLELPALAALAKPVHLLCCAATELTPVDPETNLYRGAVSAVLSPVAFSVGDQWCRWSATRPAPTLAAAVTASAAALNSHMGAKSMRFGPAVTFLMTALDLRLGLWLPHPTQAAHKNLMERLFTGWTFYKELAGWSRARGRDVLLSDGGHFENMALYELIRRHCRYIVASDCGQDSDAAFDDFGNLVRRVREDFGVEIRIDLSPLRPDANGLARQSMVAGDIQYPGGDTGVLLLFKPTLVGEEPVDVLQYKRRNAAFPQQSTGDQFYDEAQWESYRRLGQHVVRSAFWNIVAEDPARRDTPATIFARARRDWLAIPPAYGERLERFTSEISALDALLQHRDCHTLLRQVYKELAELAPSRSSAGDGHTGDGHHTTYTPEHASLDTGELAPSLHVIHRALLLMETVYFEEHLDANYNHPLYLGMMNYFARWAYAPLFRMWWPVLKPMYPQRFAAFVEDRFDLGSSGADQSAPREGERAAVAVRGDESSLASASWTLTERTDAALPTGMRYFAYQLTLPYQGASYTLEAAHVRVRTHHDLAAWSASDFYVPPGLWGAGIGERFLRHIVTTGAARSGIARFLVRIPTPRNGPPAVRKESADETQLYRSCGFAELEVTDGTCLTIDQKPTAFGDVLALLGYTGAPADARWLVREGDHPRWEGALRMEDRSPAKR